jgi:hypothetical protein
MRYSRLAAIIALASLALGLVLVWTLVILTIGE